MEKYYKKIWKCSVKGLLLSIFLMFMGAFLMYDFIAGKNMYNKDKYPAIGLGVFLLALGIIWFISCLSGVRSIKKEMAQTGLDESLLSQDLDSGSDYKYCNVGRQYAIHCDGSYDLIFLDNALIVYTEVVSHTKKGVTSYSYYVKVVERDGESKQLSAKDENEMRAIFSDITRTRPYVLTQMDKTTRQLVKKNLPEIIKTVDERKRQYESEIA